MAFAWANTFVPATGSGGMSNGDHTATDEWIFSRADNCYVQRGGGATASPTFTFDMSAGPGDKKGFWIWVEWYCDNAAGFRVDEIRLVEAGGPTTLWTDSAPGISITQTSGGEKHWVIPIPDSAFSGDPAINQLRVEFDVTNLHTGNNRLRFSGIRLSKSPFTAAQEVDLPSSLSGQGYAAYLASGLATLGAENNEDIVLIPDQSGGGRHLLRRSGTTCQYKTADGGYIDFPSGANRFFAHWGSRVTGNHIWHTEIYPEDTTLTQGVWSTALEFIDVVVTPTDPNDKNILGIDDEGSGDKFLLMSGDGSAGAHKYGATTVTFDAWVRVTQWVQDSGNEHQWINDDASPDIDAASGSNNLYTYSFGNRESNDRPFQGRMKEFWVVEDQAVGVTEGDIDSARDDTIWGGAGGGTPQVIAVGVLAETNSLVTAQAVKPIFQSVGALAEIDTLIAAQSVKPIIESIGVLGEIGSLVSLTGRKIAGIGIVTESDSLVSIQAVKPIFQLVGSLAEIETLNEISTIKVTDVGLIAEADSLNAIQALKPILTSVGLVSEVETLNNIPVLKPIDQSVGTLAEADTLIAVQAVKEIVAAVGALSQTETLVSVQAFKTVEVGVLAEVETLISVQAVKPIIGSVGLVTELDSLVSIQALKPIVESVGVLAGSDTLISVSGLKTVPVSPLVETDSLVAVTVQIGGDQVISVGSLAEIDTLNAIQAVKVIIQNIGVLAETDSLIAISAGKFVNLGTITELNSLVAVAALKPILRSVGAIAEANSLIDILVESVVIAALAETNSLIDITGPKTVNVSPLAETETLIDIAVIAGAIIDTILGTRTYADSARRFKDTDRTYQTKTRSY